MATMTVHTVLARGADHVETRVGDQIMMMSIAQGKYFALEDSARRIWDLLETPRSVGSLLDALVQEYAVERSQCERDILPFIGKLVENGLIVEASDSSAA